VAPIVGTEQLVTLPRVDNNFGGAEIRYTLPKCTSESGCKQAVRVALRSGVNDNNSGDGSHRPTEDCANDDRDDTDDLVFDVLPSERPQDLCNFDMLVTLTDNLQCGGKECLVDTVKVVEVVSGVFYEYIPTSCVTFPFYNDPAKIFSGNDVNIAMCGNKKLPSAISTCCGSYGDRLPIRMMIMLMCSVNTEERD
jgi:hypothetical protein